VLLLPIKKREPIISNANLIFQILWKHSTFQFLFFTTKSLGEGIGLGLYTCKKIVHEHGGALFFRSGDGITEFVVVLPE